MDGWGGELPGNLGVFLWKQSWRDVFFGYGIFFNYHESMNHENWRGIFYPDVF